MKAVVTLALVSLLVVLLMMLAELFVSKRNEADLMRRGAVAPPDEVYRTMRWAYPLTFSIMAVEGAAAGPPGGLVSFAGAAVLAVSKLLKVWAITALGTRWTFRVLVLPGAPLVAGGPYAWIRHPNYVAVAGELIGMALLVGARVTGPIGVLCFAYLLRKRIAAEERALGLS